MTIEARIDAALNADHAMSPWKALIAFFRADREGFYLLACNGVGPRASQFQMELAALAMAIREAIHQTYEIERTAGGANLRSRSGGFNPIPSEFVGEVTEFLREIDGKTSTSKPGKDYEGTEISEAETRFKLGEEKTWEVEHRILQRSRSIRPFVLQVSPDDLAHLAVEPAYVTYELLECARKSVLAPTSVFQGLKRGNTSPLTVNTGWAFCGKPRWTYRNDGTQVAAPDGMVFVVYADEAGFVFDWDWVKEYPHDAGFPLDWRLRFDDCIPKKGDAVLDLPKELKPGTFDPTKASYSSRGDCIFCYMSDDESCAERINSDLTVFKELGSEEITGFKVKNIQRIIQKDKSIRLDDAPGLTVSVDAILLASFRHHPEDNDAKVQIYTVLIRALHKKLGDPPTVTLPNDDNAPAYR